ncbi:MAG: T9SS type A sorting domain-containing protein [Bacteroidales bacterium]|nr:T9SS type A sorting domain-containing protein [Bacteroidales bacterium]
MKRFAIILISIIVSLTAFAQQGALRVTQSDYNHASYSFKAPQPSITPVTVGQRTFNVIEMEGTTPSTAVGRPDLPIVSQMIELPVCEDVKVEITDLQVKSLDPVTNYILPVQPSPSKSDRTPLPFAFDSNYYALPQTDKSPAAWVEKLGVGRDRNLALLRISPIIYSPATGKLELITSMTITLTYQNADIEATQTLMDRYYSPDFSIGNSLLTTLPSSKAVRDAAPLHYLIVAHSSFSSALQDFIDWKKRQGFIVTVGYTGDINVGTTSTSIAAYIKSFYTNATDELPAPTYLLLVGDVQQIPPFESRCNGNPDSDHITDLYYTTWTEGDNIPDCYMGRFSANSVAELTPQIEKTIYYQRYDFDDDSYLGTGVLIAGEDRGYSNDNAYQYADPAMDYVAKYYVNAAGGYTNVHYFKNNVSFAPTGVTVEGSSQTTATAATLRNIYNQGCGWVNYSAHGYDDEWSIPSFTTSHVNAMTNYGKPSFMVGNCCLSGKFNTTYSSSCLGEALLRRGDNAGAVGYIGGTNSTYWPQDFCWAVGVRTNISNQMDATYSATYLGMYDRLFHTHNEPYTAWHTTAGSLNTAGNTAVETYGRYTLYYWEIYELFGDPSLMPWLGPAADATVESANVITTGTTSFAVNTTPYAYVAITTAENHDLVAAAYATANGSVVLTLPDDLTPGNYELAVWSQNHKPFFKDIHVIVADGPYVMITKMQPTKPVTSGQIVQFDLMITNVGNQVPTSGVITLSSDNEGVTIVSPQAHFTSCPPGDTVRLNAVWPIFISKDVKDGHTLNFTANVDFGQGTSVYRKRLSVSAPILSVSNAKATPMLTPDSSSTITCRLTNRGSHVAEDITLTLVNDFGFLNQMPDIVHLDSLSAGDSRTISFYLSLDAHVPYTLVPFYLYATTPMGTQLIDTLYFSCGIDITEDFETGDFSRYPWSQNSRPWEITSVDPFDGSFCARSKTNMQGYAESRLNINWTSSINDSISFYYKVSSEEGYDFFKFFIDGTEKLSASGEVGWTRASFFVPAGNHIISFSYSKDYQVVEGSDCAWIDNITLPYTGNRCSFFIDEICHNTPYQFADQPIPTDNIGTYLYTDTTTVPWQYLALSVVDQPEVTIETVTLPNPERCKLLVAHGADSYVWSTGDTSATIGVCPTHTATYTVTGYRKGCSSEASTTILSINDPRTQPSVAIYPNPAQQEVTIQADGIISIDVVNIMGQTILHKTINSDCTRLDLRNFADGVFFIRINMPNSTVVRKLIKK